MKRLHGLGSQKGSMEIMIAILLLIILAYAAYFVYKMQASTGNAYYQAGQQQER